MTLSVANTHSVGLIIERRSVALQSSSCLYLLETGRYLETISGRCREELRLSFVMNSHTRLTSGVCFSGNCFGCRHGSFQGNYLKRVPN